MITLVKGRERLCQLFRVIKQSKQRGKMERRKTRGVLGEIGTYIAVLHCRDQRFEAFTFLGEHACAFQVLPTWIPLDSEANRRFRYVSLPSHLSFFA